MATPRTATPTGRRCECGDCVRIRQDSVSVFHNDQGDTPDGTGAAGESRGWSRADRAAADMPLRARIWGADR